MPPALADVGSPTVTPQGAGGSDTWEYTVVGVQRDGGRSQAPASGSTAVGSAELNDTDFNRITWTDVAGYDLYEIYRTTSVGSVGDGLVGTVGPGVQSFDDVGQVVDAATASASNTTGEGRAIDLSSFAGSVNVEAIGIGTGTYEVQESVDKTNWAVNGAALTADGERAIDATQRFARVVCTAFTSGTPKALATGDTGY
jgi:hypothetical protein